MPELLDGDGIDPAFDEGTRGKCEQLAESVADDGPRAGGKASAGPGEVARELVTQHRVALGRRVPEDEVGVAHRRLGGGRPARDGEVCGVDDPGAQIESVPVRPVVGRRAGRWRDRGVGHPGARADRSAQPPLGRQARVDLGDRVARQPEIGRQLPRGRQPRSRLEPAAEGVAQGTLQFPGTLGPQGGEVEVDPGGTLRHRSVTAECG
jgi:hypothetical protein